MRKILSAGAEATIYETENSIIKIRREKLYRHPQLDKKITKRRTKSEIKILKKASEIISAPIPSPQKKPNQIEMTKIEGKKLSLTLNKYSKKTKQEIMFQIGKNLAKLHLNNIAHSDLTTSNIIYNEKTKQISFIDFGLSSLNAKYEDKGVDIHLLKQALEAKHFQDHTELFEEFKKGYESENKEEAKKSFQKLLSIEKRGRYKH